MGVGTPFEVPAGGKFIPFASSQVHSTAFTVTSFVSSSKVGDSGSLSFGQVLSVFHLVFRKAGMRLFQMDAGISFRFLLSIGVLPSVVQVDLPTVQTFSSR